MQKLRILLLAPDCNPESVTTPQLAFAHAEALSRHHRITLVVRASNESAIRRTNADFAGIHAVQLPLLDALLRWAIRRIFKYDYGRPSLTAFAYPLQIAFEWRAWRQLRQRIHDDEFDVVLRILPVIAVLPSPFAWFLRKGPVPFVIGPLNGGLPWPTGYPQLDAQRQQPGWWFSNLRNCYRFLPFSRSTYSKASAIIAGSSFTYTEFARFREKLFFVPGENALEPEVFSGPPRPVSREETPLRLVFVGRLIPLKACDLALRGSADLLRSGQAQLTIVGDGAERGRLQSLTRELRLESAVTFTGWVSRTEVLEYFRRADVFVFPSLREFGGAVVFEALALGAVPVVTAFGGPGDIVTPDVGFTIPLTNEVNHVRELERILNHLSLDREHLAALRRRGMAYARDQLTWEGKAQAVSKVLVWATGRGPKPAMPPPSFGSASTAATH